MFAIFNELRLLFFQIVFNGRLKSAEAKVEAVLHSSREGNKILVASGGQLVYYPAAREAQTEHLGDFVYTFARSVVARFTDKLIHAVFRHMDKFRVTAGHNKDYEREIYIGVLDVVGGDMSFYVIDGHKRSGQREG